METSVPTTKGQILIPKRLREKYGIEPGTKVVFEETDNGLLIKSMDRNFFRKFRGILEASGSLAEEMDNFRQEEQLFEDKKLALFKK